MKQKIIVSFSGGRTSAFMLHYLFKEWQHRYDYEMIAVFANTGKESEGTLFFVDECSQEWDIPIIWIESKRSDNGKKYSVSHRIVTYETASRNGEPFEDMIKSIGIPSTNTPFCSYQLKRKAIESYAKSIGWKNYRFAIGVRIDESKRLNDDPKLFYPLVSEIAMNKRMISEWWQKQSFDLNIHPDEGNCDNCWKKDYPRLVRNMIRNPESYNWWEQMETKYGNIKHRDNDTEPPYYFYRGQKSVMDIRKLALLSQAELKQLTMFDALDGCSESCEII